MAWNISAAGFGPLSWEAWTTVGTWLLAAVAAVVAWGIARRSRRDARAQIDAIREAATAQVAAAEQAAIEQRDLTDRMAQAHLDMLREDLRARLLLHYATVWDSPRMIEQRKRLSGMLLSSVQSGASVSPDGVGRDVPNFFESVGLLVERGQLDAEMVWHTFGYCAMRYGRVLRWFFTKDREARGDPQLWTAALELLATLQKIEEGHTKRAHSEFARDEVVRFLREETQAPPAPVAAVRPGR